MVSLMTIAIGTAATEKNNNSFSTSSFISDDDSYGAGCDFLAQGDTVNAGKCFHKGAKAGNVESMYVYALFKMGGMGGIKANPKAGLRMIQQAANKGNTNALCFLGELYESGEYGYPVNKPEALKLYMKASQAGSLDGHIACGNTYWQNGDTALAMQYWAKAVEDAIPYFVHDEQRDALSQITYNLGWLYQNGDDQDLLAAADYYQQSVLYGNTKEAAFQLGIIYLDGANIYEPNLELATDCLLMAADAGVVEACAYIGDMLRISGADEQAMFYYLEGANGGDQNAMYALAEIYYDRGEFDSAVYWASLCPDNVLAIYLLGCIYYVQEDLLQAEYYWEQCAYRFHHADAIKMLRMLYTGESEWCDSNNGFIRT